MVAASGQKGASWFMGSMFDFFTEILRTATGRAGSDFRLDRFHGRFWIIPAPVIFFATDLGLPA